MQGEQLPPGEQRLPDDIAEQFNAWRVDREREALRTVADRIFESIVGRIAAIESANPAKTIAALRADAFSQMGNIEKELTGQIEALRSQVAAMSTKPPPRKRKR